LDHLPIGETWGAGVANRKQTLNSDSGNTFPADSELNFANQIGEVSHVGPQTKFQGHENMPKGPALHSAGPPSSPGRL
jgi:hypothetical protein